MATAKSILTDIRTVVSGITGIVRVNSSRKNDAPASGTYSASVLYRGEAIDQFVINQSGNRMEHIMPVAIDVRTTSASDDDLIDKVYEVLDASLLQANKPTGAISVLPESIDEPEGEEYLTCRINLNVKFRRA
jgi:P2-related tail formation protein